MKFGLFGGARTVLGDQPSDSQLYTDYIDYVLEAEDLGYVSLFLVEHHFTGFGQISSSLGLLTYLAARTTTIRLGTAVVVLPWHNPVLLTEQAATLDLLSDGRFDFGVGRGYRANEFEGFCIPMDEAEERYQETLAFIRKAWTTEGRFSHHGKYWRFDDVIVEPAPAQKPHPPLWIGAASHGSIAKAAEGGFNLLLAQTGSPEDVGAQIATFREGVEARGAIFDPMSVGVTRALHIAATAEEREAAHQLRSKFVQSVRTLARPRSAHQPLNFVKDYASLDEQRRATEVEALIGSTDEIIQRLKAYEAQGVEYVLLMDVSGSRDMLRTFAREIMPEFAERPTGRPALARA